MGTLKKLSLNLILLGALCSLAKADDIENYPIGPFGTLNNFDNSMTIPSDKAQDLLNVDITPNGKSVKKRKGYSTAFTLTSNSATHGVYKFYASNGNDITLFFNDRYLTSSINGNSQSVLFSTGTQGATYQCVDYAGSAYCANSNKDRVLQTDGVTYTPLSATASSASIVAVTPDRLVLAGLPTAPNRIDFSKSADFSTWAAPFLAGTDPNQVTIAAPGARITHLRYAFNRLMWFKDSSFGYILFGTNLADWKIVIVSDLIGTLDNSSVYYNNALFFRGQDAHFYSFDGSNLTKLSREISGTINQSQSRQSNSFTQTTQADFAAGLYTNSVYVDTQTVSGVLQLTFPESFDTYRDGTHNTKKVWDTLQTGSATGVVGTEAGQGVIRHNGSSLGRVCVRTDQPLADFQQGTTYHFDLGTIIPVDPSGLTKLFFVLSSSGTFTANPDGLTNNFQLVFLSTWQPLGTSAHYYLSSISNSTDGTLYTGSASSTSFVGATVDFYLSTTTWRLSLNNKGTTTNFTSLNGTHNYPHSSVYAYLALADGVSEPGVLVFDNFRVYPESVVYDSQVNNAPSLTNWDAFQATYSNGSNGSHAFYMRASTNTFLQGDATPSWNSISPGSIPTFSTGTYFQFRDSFLTNWSASTQTTTSPTLSDGTINWFEGLQVDKAYGGYFENAIWWNIQVGGGSSYNNRVARFDLINQGWTLYDIPMNGFYVRNNAMYFGSSTSGTIYRFGSADNDNSAAINAFWKSKDFFGQAPYLSKDLVQISVNAVKNTGSNLTVAYDLNGSTTTSSYSFPMNNADGLFVTNNRTLPGGKTGYFYNIQFGNNAADQPFEVPAVMVGLRTKPWNAN